LNSKKLRLLSRVHCHLCETAAVDLNRLGIPFDTIDVDMDAVLADRYGDAVPVVLDGEFEIVRAPFTLPQLQAALARHGLA
jgi:hypothetical protein